MLASLTVEQAHMLARVLRVSVAVLGWQFHRRNYILWLNLWSCMVLCVAHLCIVFSLSSKLPIHPSSECSGFYNSCSALGAMGFLNEKPQPDLACSYFIALEVPLEVCILHHAFFFPTFQLFLRGLKNLAGDELSSKTCARPHQTHLLSKPKCPSNIDSAQLFVTG